MSEPLQIRPAPVPLRLTPLQQQLVTLLDCMRPLGSVRVVVPSGMAFAHRQQVASPGTVLLPTMARGKS